MKKRREVNPGTAARIKARRQELGITQENLAELVARCEQSIRLYENGHLGVSPKMLKRIAVALGTTAEYLERGANSDKRQIYDQEIRAGE